MNAVVKPRDKRIYQIIPHTAAHCYERLAHRLTKKERITVSQWSDKYRWLSGKGSSEKGLWRTSRTPFLRDIMDDLSPHSPVKKIVIMKSSQVGVTELSINWIGYVMHHSPAPFMVLLPTEESRDAWVQQKLNTLINETDVISEIMGGSRGRDSSNRKDLKEFPGGMLFLAGGNSPNSYAQRSARYVMMDDLDRFPAQIGEEGDPVGLARGRCKAFPNYKMLLVSTPTVHGASHIQAEYEASDQRRYHVPCPHCGELQVLQWKNMQWSSGGEQVWYACDATGCVIEEWEKPNMLAKGVWLAQNPGSKTHGYHLSAIYAPIGLGPSWIELVDEWKKAQGDHAKLKVFINTHLGEPWRDATRDIRPQVLMQRAEPYKLRTAPVGCLILTAGVDTQDDRLAVQIVGWGKGEVSWVIDWLEIYGDPGREELWQKLADYLNTPISNGFCYELLVQATAIDSGGHHTHDVYNFVRKKLIRRPMAIQGAKRPSGPILSPRPSYQDVNWRKQTIKKGVALYQVGVNTAKHTLTQRLASDADVEAVDRMIRFSDQLPMDYYNQLTAEVFDPLKNRFICQRGRRNEGLDTYVYAMAAAHISDPDVRVHAKTNKEWDRLRDTLEGELIQPLSGSDSHPMPPAKSQPAKLYIPT
jgi:phage terminase large subunit GpA-like protein